MPQNIKPKKSILSFIFILSICVPALLTLIFIYHYDNKYTSKGPQALNGVLLIDEHTLDSYPVLFLVHGWEYYSGRLLTPEDFKRNAPLPDRYIFIGQYGGFETDDLSASPHGSASYRLNISIPDEIRPYMLELPEIFSAYRVFINGKETVVMGNPEPSVYQPKTGNRTVLIQGSKSIEILVAVSDFSHIYSGMVYPPAFGTPDNIIALLTLRLILRSVLCATAAIIGLLSILIGLLRRKNMLTVLYGLICLFFVGYVSYPITQTFFAGFYPLYTIENFSFCAMFVIVMLLQIKICSVNKNLSRCFILFGIFVCSSSAALPFLLPYGNLNVMVFYSNLITSFKWLTAGFITITSIHSFYKYAVHSKTLLCGILIFDCALVTDRFLPMYEPIVTGWFTELAGFVLVLAIGLVIGKDVAIKYKDNAILEERVRSMERLSEMRQTYYPLLQQKIEEAKTARHDLHHHFVMIGGFLINRRYEKLQSYVAQYQSSICLNEPIRYAKNDVANVLAYHYAHLADKCGIELTLRLEIDSETKIADADLCSLMSNLLENGVEACLRQKNGNSFIRFTIKQKKSSLAIQMENSCDENLVRNGSGFNSSKEKGRKGYGLDSIKSIVSRYSGTAEFHYDATLKVFYSTAILG